MDASYALAGEDLKGVNPFIDLLAASEKIEQGRKPVTKQSVAEQNRQAYAQLAGMMVGVQKGKK